MEGGCIEQFGDRNTQSSRDALDTSDSDVTPPMLYACDVGPVKTAPSGELLLAIPAL